MSKTYEVSDNDFFEPYSDSHTAIALRLVLNFKVEELFIVGYDGYSESISSIEQELFKENSYMFEKLKDNGNLKFCFFANSSAFLSCVKSPSEASLEASQINKISGRRLSRMNGKIGRLK